eukprot:1426893-Rhodomonas_salina.2
MPYGSTGHRVGQYEETRTSSSPVTHVPPRTYSSLFCTASLPLLRFVSTGHRERRQVGQLSTVSSEPFLSGSSIAKYQYRTWHSAFVARYVSTGQRIASA